MELGRPNKGKLRRLTPVSPATTPVVKETRVTPEDEDPDKQPSEVSRDEFTDATTEGDSGERRRDKKRTHLDLTEDERVAQDFRAPRHTIDLSEEGEEEHVESLLSRRTTRSKHGESCSQNRCYPRQQQKNR